mmetsp:Transcript_40566/g.94867  ORF Transcript_40566/g.94867 Transcript_40566/m.94867 type:complete len:139 (-) Transcript_40566:224-640(-)
MLACVQKLSILTLGSGHDGTCVRIDDIAPGINHNECRNCPASLEVNAGCSHASEAAMPFLSPDLADRCTGPSSDSAFDYRLTVRGLASGVASGSIRSGRTDMKVEYNSSWDNRDPFSTSDIEPDTLFRKPAHHTAGSI